ncbi:3-oxoacyl-ACP reductase FabG [Nocardia sp. CA2R105]|uniref:SDR family NAD(P)-dependent oxidoreductase n=1 Tax=Nocardia coffeae TaxID=2873381 RepID=UPI001CA72949|nr:3-oxoacyl-ACP reductase family protein [Nocardia coffeae]MBY8863595.1 3-oxoacyl-ACP reductase FabG [Nocardia coffeae]
MSVGPHDHAPRVAIVTGGTRGIGAALTRRLAKRGSHVVAIYRGDDASAQRIQQKLDGVTAVRADLADPEACVGLVEDVLAEHGRIDHLVNNAGLLLEARSSDTTITDWDQVVAVNLSAAFHLARTAVPVMRAAGYGRIVNISSVTAVMGSPSEAAYGAAKAGLHGLTRSLARETARHGITVNTVVPGVFDTDMTASMPEKTRAAILGMIPVGRRGNPDELAAAVEFLLGDDAGYCTGSVLTVDGGLSMGG